MRYDDLTSSFRTVKLLLDFHFFQKKSLDSIFFEKKMKSGSNFTVLNGYLNIVTFQNPVAEAKHAFGSASVDFLRKHASTTFIPCSIVLHYQYMCSQIDNNTKFSTIQQLVPRYSSTTLESRMHAPRSTTTSAVPGRCLRYRVYSYQQNFRF